VCVFASQSISKTPRIDKNIDNNRLKAMDARRTDVFCTSLTTMLANETNKLLLSSQQEKPNHYT